MDTPQRICVAVALQRYFAFTPVALRQRDLALVLAKAHGARVDLVSVDAPIGLMPDASTTDQKITEFAQPLVDAGIEVETYCYEGPPPEMVEAHIEATECDLLIMGTHSKRGVLDILLGTNADALVRSAPCAVLMIRPTAQEAEAAKDVMIPGLPFILPGS